MRAAILLTVVLMVVGVSSVYGKTLLPPPVSQVVLVLWHGMEWVDIEDLPINTGQAIGLMNTRTGGGLGVEAAYLSISAGARAVGTAGAGSLFMDYESHQFTLHTGLPSSSIVQPFISQLLGGQNVSYTVIPGALASAITKGGKGVSAYGNSDIEEPRRWAGVVAMDRSGRIWSGDVGRNVLLEDEDYPYGVKTNYDLLTANILASDSHLVVVDLGDPYRLGEYAPNLLPEQADLLRSRMRKEARLFLTNLGNQIGEERVVLVIAPYPGAERGQQGQWLTPVLFLGRDSGLTVSGTTRWPGLITNMDIAPMILELLGVEQSETMIGRSVRIKPAQHGFEKVQHLEERLLATARHRGWVLRVLVAVQILLYIGALGLLIIDRALSRSIIRSVQIGLTIWLAVPGLLLAMSGGTVLVVVFGTGLVFSYFLTHSPLETVMAVALTTGALIILDILTGGWLIRFSYLGYDAIGGARFYGLGNEFMGILIGSAIMGWAVMTQLSDLPEWVMGGVGVIMFSGALAVIGAPRWGTNVGGAITAVLGFGVTLGAFWHMKFRARTVFLVLALVCAVLGALMAVDSSKSIDQQSHIGQTVTLLQRDGWKAVFSIVQRKLGMNLKLMRYSIWSRALVVALGVMGASFVWPSSFIRWLVKTYPTIAKGIGGVVVGSVGALLFNDSGVVAAATCVFFAATTLIILALELKHDLTSSKSYIEDDSDRD